MSKSLYEQHCQPCTIGTRAMLPEDVNDMLASVPRWKKVSVDGMDNIRREFYFKGFKEAADFAHKIARISEREDHHPTLLIEVDKVVVTWWTHKANGLHLNDFIMAAKTDLIASSGPIK
ncbi:MAG: 4a-hydroxytetrahydrobiopterin dehydratase [Pseudohongiellaceae bacterium]|nr:4a-hydroxytetrahydrobiopterin dehydratase [Pseudohongiellaceae bacterium]